MYLLVVVINDESNLHEILDTFYEDDIGGATVIDSMGMGHLMAEQISIFARFADLTGDSGKFNKTIFTLVENREKLDQAVAALEEIVGDFEEPDTGMWFSLPVEQAKGINSKFNARKD